MWRHYCSLSAIICECGDTTCSVCPYRLSIYMECGDTPHSIISIWIQIWVWIWSVDLHGVWRHSTFHNIHMDMDVTPCLHIISHMECGDILQSIISIWIQIWIWIWSVDLQGVWRHSTFHNIHMDMDVSPCLHITGHMECGDILQSIISIQSLFTD